METKMSLGDLMSLYQQFSPEAQAKSKSVEIQNRLMLADLASVPTKAAMAQAQLAALKLNTQQNEALFPQQLEQGLLANDTAAQNLTLAKNQDLRAVAEAQLRADAAKQQATLGAEQIAQEQFKTKNMATDFNLGLETRRLQNDIAKQNSEDLATSRNARNINNTLSTLVNMGNLNNTLTGPDGMPNPALVDRLNRTMAANGLTLDLSPLNPMATATTAQKQFLGMVDAGLYKPENINYDAVRMAGSQLVDLKATQPALFDETIMKNPQLLGVLNAYLEAQNTAGVDQNSRIQRELINRYIMTR